MKTPTQTVNAASRIAAKHRNFRLSLTCAELNELNANGLKMLRNAAREHRQIAGEIRDDNEKYERFTRDFERI